MSVFIEARPGLLRIARQILGDPSDAEDVIQETWLRWLGTDRAVVGSPWALLRTTTVRLAINVVQSAWRRRESCGSPWLPDLADGHASPEAVAEQHDAVERAVLLLMETLTPTQRAAYILREGFGHPYAQISGLLGLSVANARQQVSRAQHRLAADRRRQPVDPVAHRRLVQAFLAAARSGELGLLEGILATDAGRLPTRR
nr:sigma-70 family RNA polymerase sigma factor [Streptomyces sp. S3(2020)]